MWTSGFTRTAMEVIQLVFLIVHLPEGRMKSRCNEYTLCTPAKSASPVRQMDNHLKRSQRHGLLLSLCTATVFTSKQQKTPM
jgi:hypothetical protein